MNVIIHQDLTVIAGDVWKIYGVIQNDNGSPMDITQLLADDDIEWMLVKDGTTYELTPDDVTYTGIDPDEGTFFITVLPADTITVAPGRYTDFLRINTPDGPRTRWTGEIHVRAGPPAVP